MATGCGTFGLAVHFQQCLALCLQAMPVRDAHAHAMVLRSVSAVPSILSLLLNASYRCS